MNDIKKPQLKNESVEKSSYNVMGMDAPSMDLNLLIQIRDATIIINLTYFKGK